MHEECEKDVVPSPSSESLSAMVKANKELMKMFPESDGPMKSSHICQLCSLVLAFTVCILLVFSGVLRIGYDAYDALLQLESVWYYFVGAGFLGFFVLHALNCYRWPLWKTAISGGICLYLTFIGMACHAKRYPSAPLIVLHLQFPISVTLFRLTRLSGSLKSFFMVAVFCFSAAAFFVIVAWVAWIFTDDMMWGSDTKTKLRSKLTTSFRRYDLHGWEQCEIERALPNGADETVIADCSRMELIAYLIWSCPAIEAMVLVFIAGFCAQRYWALHRKATPSERALRFVVFVLCFFATAFWIACSTAGASMGLSRVMFASIGTAGCVFAVWMAFAFDLGEVLAKTQDSVVFKALSPALGSDYFSAAMFCATQFAILFFLVLEVVVRQLEKLFCVEGSGHRWLTKRGRSVANFLTGKHWASTLEKSFNLSILFLVFFLFSRFTPVFLSWLGSKLENMSFSSVVGIFYVVGIIMFLLPPVPGVPVYMAAGTIIVSRGKQEPWLGFWSGIAFASVLSLLLKLSAVVMQQKGIGEQFGKSLYVQQLVGVHTISIKAIEKILKKDGLTMEKVAILCGGPDWPTSVLTGILRLRLLPMLIGTLPCFFLIVPCVLGGASLNEESLKSFSPIIIMLVGITQGGVMLGALVFIGKETERSQDELSEEREEHKILIKKSEEAAEKARLYKEVTSWTALTALEKSLLVPAVFLEVMMCWILQVLGGMCFRSFAIGSDIGAKEVDGGLDGDVMKMIKPPGYAVFAAILCGVLLFASYGCVLKRRTRNRDMKVYAGENA